jgi:hypothetical protein
MPLTCRAHRSDVNHLRHWPQSLMRCTSGPLFQRSGHDCSPGREHKYRGTIAQNNWRASNWPFGVRAEQITIPASGFAVTGRAPLWRR